MRRGILPRLGAGAVAMALVASCGGGGGGEEESSFSLQGCEPKHFIPGHSTELCGSQMLQYMYTGLISFDEKNEPVNRMAESIESDDQKVWTIKIKKGWKFHNGEDVTVDSYIGAWNAYAYGPHAYDANYFFEKIEGYGETSPLEGDPKARSFPAWRRSTTTR
ncbi:MAG: hypothetical protein GEV07_17420 [Streptosporangiales bacterium]|nr:hypothetical protein [Streptosporangiales bacterium]